MRNDVISFIRDRVDALVAANLGSALIAAVHAQHKKHGFKGACRCNYCAEKRAVSNWPGYSGYENPRISDPLEQYRSPYMDDVIHQQRRENLRARAKNRLDCVEISDVINGPQQKNSSVINEGCDSDNTDL